MSTESLVAAAVTTGGDGANMSDFEQTLKRLIDRIGKILQAEKCLFVINDPARGVLCGIHPALGLTDEQVRHFIARPSDEGLSAEVFRTGMPVMLPDASRDSRAIADGLALKLGAKSVVCVPLVVETRDDQNQVTERKRIGVLYALNKNFEFGSNGVFVQEDVQLLQRMSVSAAALISSVQLFREVVQEKQELIHTIESLYIGLAVLAASGRILQINSAARLLLHMPDSDLIVGRRYDEVVTHPHLRDLLHEALGGPVPLEVNGEIVIAVDPASVPDGQLPERTYQVQCAPVRGNENNEIIGIVVLLNDVTEIREVERIKSAFISTVSHELRTPLTSIKGFIATLLADREGFYDKATQFEFYQIIDTECDRLTRLIDDLLSLARIEQGQPLQFNFQPVDLRAVLHKVIVAQRASIVPERHTLQESFPADFPLIEADPDKIDQIFTNLVSNAIKYSPHGGVVTVAGNVTRDAHSVQVSVSDSGIGIPREHLSRIFERFHRVDNRDSREIGGTGIGLFLVKSLAESHHGTVDVRSELGRGSTFKVTFPIHQPG